MDKMVNGTNASSHPLPIQKPLLGATIVLGRAVFKIGVEYPAEIVDQPVVARVRGGRLIDARIRIATVERIKDDEYRIGL